MAEEQIIPGVFQGSFCKDSEGYFRMIFWPRNEGERHEMASRLGWDEWPARAEAVRFEKMPAPTPATLYS